MPSYSLLFIFALLCAPFQGQPIRQVPTPAAALLSAPTPAVFYGSAALEYFDDFRCQSSPTLVPLWTSICSPLFTSNSGNTFYSANVTSCSPTRVALTVFSTTNQRSGVADSCSLALQRKSMVLQPDEGCQPISAFGPPYVRLKGPPSCTPFDPTSVFTLEAYSEQNCPSGQLESHTPISLGACVLGGLTPNGVNASVVQGRGSGGPVAITPFQTSTLGCNTSLPPLLPPIQPSTPNATGPTCTNAQDGSDYSYRLLLPVLLVALPSSSPSPTPSLGPSTPSNANPTTLIPMPAIVGIAVGVPLTLLAAALMCLCLRRRKANIAGAGDLDDTVIVNNGLRPSIYRPTVKAQLPGGGDAKVWNGWGVN